MSMRILFVVIGSMVVVTTLSSTVAANEPVDYLRDVVPVLREHCLDCHGPSEQESELRLDNMTFALLGGGSGERAVVPGSSEKSYLIELVTSDDSNIRMPPDGERLSDNQVATLKAWIEDKERWEPAIHELAAKATTHWSFQPLRRPGVPANDFDHPIDAFIAQGLARANLDFSSRASRVKLVRRLFLVMHGVQPTIAQIDDFLDVEGESRDDDWSQWVEQVSASDRYGQRLAMHWLDLVRFGETQGFETNRERPNAWHYRDWVIDAFNADIPYDQFVIRQLVGDAVDDPIGTGFLVAGPNDIVKGQDPKLGLMQRQDELADMINTTGTAFMGLTLGCARCHNHKFDPISQTDYYALQAVLAGVNHGERSLPLSKSTQQELADVRSKIESTESELVRFVRAESNASRMIDDASLSKGFGFGVTVLQTPAGQGVNPAGTSPGFAQDPGSDQRSPNVSGGKYTWWKNEPNQDVIAYHPRVKGKYRVWISWGAGFHTHTKDAKYLIDADGQTETDQDQTLIATIDQQLRADGRGEIVGKPLWSGFQDAGLHQLTGSSAIVLRGGDSGTAITADAILLEPVTDDGSVNPSQPRFRPMVQAKRNTEQFQPVEARFVRMTIHQTNGGQPCIDELEVFSDDENVALAASGTVPTSSGDFVHALHKLEHINDGQYGNPKSWISNVQSGGWVQLEFPKTYSISRIVWARDRQQKYADRLAIEYQFDGSIDGQEWFRLCGSGDRIPWKTTIQAPEAQFDFEAFPPAEAAYGRKQLAELKSLRQSETELHNGIRVYAGTFAQPRAVHRLYRGEPGAEREVVHPDAVAAIGRLGLAPDAPEQERRMALAKWMTRPDHPLTARVIVNRLWMYHFGTGLVDTPSDFGGNGGMPSHPQLLDWLASELVEKGWSLKHIHRLILTSETWQQDSRPDPRAIAIDADTRLLWRFPPRRLEAEGIRDCILMASGKLDFRHGGRGFSAFEVEMENVRHYHPKKNFGPDDWRRMIYMTKVRQERDAVFGVFDCPDGSQVTPKRTRSTTPLQALNLLNSRFVIQQAEILSQRLENQAESDAERIRLAYRLCFGRRPNEEELTDAMSFVHARGLVQFSRAMLNANEMVFIP